MRVLVPFDVASPGERAARYAVSSFGPRGDTRITAVHLTEESLADENKRPSEKTIASVIESFEEEYGVEVELDVIIRTLDGEFSKEKVRTNICRITDEVGADTVVMGYEEKTFFDDLLNESTAERILEDSEVPVVLVP